MTQHDFQPEDGARMDESQSIDEQPKHHTPQGVTLRDVVLVVQADEAHHRALPHSCRRDSHEGLKLLTKPTPKSQPKKPAPKRKRL